MVHKLKLFKELSNRTYYDSDEMIRRIMELEHIKSYSEARKIADDYTK